VSEVDAVRGVTTGELRRGCPSTTSYIWYAVPIRPKSSLHCEMEEGEFRVGTESELRSGETLRYGTGVLTLGGVSVNKKKKGEVGTEFAKGAQKGCLGEKKGQS